MGLIRPDGGSVTFRGVDVTHMPMYKRGRMGMGYLAQEPSIFRKLTVEENVMAILETLDITAKERKDRLEELLEELDLARLRKQKAMTLSGGERRRLEITRALVTNPNFIMLDEPFSGVDPLAVHDVQQIILQLKKRNLGILITDHNVRETLEVVDRAYLMFQGRILVEGPSEFLVNDKKAKKAVERAYDTLRSSPTRTDMSVYGLETEAMNKLEDLEDAVAAQNVDAIITVAMEIVSLMDERNRKLKILN